MAPDVNSKLWGNQPRTTLKSCSVDDQAGFTPIDEPSRDIQHGTNMGNIGATDEMTSFFRNIIHNYCDEPTQRKYHGLAKQKRQNNNTDDDQDSDSGSDPDHLEGDAILPELIKLTLAQHRMILSLRDVNKETDLQLRITNARLDLVEEELSLMRSSLAEQATPSLFSGVRMGSSFGGMERDTTGDYIPKFDLADIGATLAAGPGHGSNFGRHGYHARDGSPSPRSSNQRRRSPRPEREEHVKRTRISHDGLGGQDPNLPPSMYIFSSSAATQSTTTVTDETSESELFGLDFPTECILDTRPETDVVPQPSLLGKLCGKMARLLLGM
ncbi:hypothetical protein INS49_007503 [Diaporthe citri]|uniref:uncharacterized protein n=1 Tax=Diaporthe citri TaxID=83186 RepID=UPI001C80848B|nr:uncharacterized protein INS49_007503 [Diaporthe citri]KAG6353331.1 hypothetical protein INS49_007503 [Diaporthe citri]